MAIPVKKRLRFKDEDDVALLRQVASQNPFQLPDSWETIQANLVILTGKNFSIKTLKDHVHLLIKTWLEKVKILKGKSGIEEDYSEKDELCQNIYDYMREYNIKSEKKRKHQDWEKLKGEVNRDKWAYNTIQSLETPLSFSQPLTLKSQESAEIDLSFGLNHLTGEHSYCDFLREEEIIVEENMNITVQNCCETRQLNEKENVSLGSSKVLTVPESTENSKQVTTPGPIPGKSKVLRAVKGRKRKVNAQRQGLEYLEKYDLQQNDIKKKQQQLEERKIEVEERKISLEEKKFDFQKEQQQIRLDLEMEERKILVEVMQKQNQLLELFVNKVLL